MSGSIYEEALAAVEGRPPSASGWARGHCPFCPTVYGRRDKNRSLSVHLESGRVVCWRCGTRCGTSGPKDYRPKPRKLGEPPPEAPEGFLTFTKALREHPSYANQALDYLESRHVSKKAIVRSGMGMAVDGKLAGRVVVPVHGVEKPWLGYVSRIWECSDPLDLPPRRPKYLPKYFNSAGLDRENNLFNMSALQVDSDKPVMVVEGVFDALPYWPHVVACLGKPAHKHVDILARSGRTLVVVLDGDAWLLGEACAKRVCLAGGRATYLRLKAKKDPGTVMPKKLWKRVLREARALEERLK